MIKTKLLLNEVQKAKDFVADANKLKHNIDIGNGYYTVDGKSLLGVLSLNLSEPVIVNVQCEADDPEVWEILKKYTAGNGC